MVYENIEVYKDGIIGLIIMNRPEVRNVLNAETIVEMEQAVEQWERHDGIKVIVLTGEGKKTFISGIDITQMQTKTALEGFNANLSNLCKKIEDSSKATIAVVNGYALGQVLSLLWHAISELPNKMPFWFAGIKPFYYS